MHYTPTKLIANVIRTKHVGQLMGSNKADDYVLKVFGREEYLLGNHKMHEYKYVRHSLTQATSKKGLSDIPVVLGKKWQSEMVAKRTDGQPGAMDGTV